MVRPRRVYRGMVYRVCRIMCWVDIGGAVRLHSIQYFRLRYRHQVRQAAHIVFWLVIAALVFIGAYSAMTEYQWATTRAQDDVKQAEADREQALDILRGNRTYITEDGEQYAKVEWRKVRLVEELGK